MTKGDSNGWQTKRAAILKAACNFIAKQIRNGVRIGRAIKTAQRQFRHRSVGDGRRIRLSEKTMQRIWYAWRELRNDAVFLLRYRPGRKSDVQHDLLRSITEASVNRGISVAEASREAGAPVSTRTIYRRLPMKHVQRLARLQRKILTQQATHARKKAELLGAR